MLILAKGELIYGEGMMPRQEVHSFVAGQCGTAAHLLAKGMLNDAIAYEMVHALGI